MTQNELQLRLENLYLNQKDELRKRHGLSPLTNEKAVRRMMADHLQKMGELVTRLNLDPDLCMVALFRHARVKLRLPEGPYSNMLGSEKSLLDALSWHLNIPRDAVVAESSTERCIARVQEDYDRAVPLMRRWGGPIQDLTNVSPSYLVVFSGFEKGVISALLDDVLDEVRHNRSLGWWMASLGWSFEKFEQLKNSPPRRL